MIVQNAGGEGSIVVEKVRASKDDKFGYNALTDTYEDLVQAGVIDPTKVTRTALQNAASIAGLLLTTEAIDRREEGEGSRAPGGRRAAAWAGCTSFAADADGLGSRSADSRWLETGDALRRPPFCLCVYVHEITFADSFDARVSRSRCVGVVLSLLARQAAASDQRRSLAAAERRAFAADGCSRPPANNVIRNRGILIVAGRLSPSTAPITPTEMAGARVDRSARRPVRAAGHLRRPRALQHDARRERSCAATSTRTTRSSSSPTA